MALDSTLDLTSFDFALKQHYVDFTVKNMAYNDRPLHGMLTKKQNAGGDVIVLPIKYGNPQGRSASFADAQSQKSSTQGIKFLLTRFSDYSLANIDNQTMEASMGDSDAFMRAATTEIDGAIDAAAQSIAIAEYRSGTGSIGVIGSVTTTVITLADPETVVFFEVGQTIGCAPTDGGTQRSGTNQITAIDRNAGTLTAATAWSTAITSLVAGDYLFVNGDLNAKLAGLDAWLPMPGVITSTAFFGVNRLQDATRLGGVNLNRVGAPIEDAMVDLAARIGREGGKPGVAWLNTTNYAALEKALGAKVQYVSPKASDAEVFFQGMKIMGPKGPITVMSDPQMFSDRVYMLEMPSWYLFSLGNTPKLLQSDGLKFLRLSNADGVEVRCGYYAVLGCDAPGHNGVAQLQ